MNTVLSWHCNIDFMRSYTFLVREKTKYYVIIDISCRRQTRLNVLTMFYNLKEPFKVRKLFQFAI